MCGRFALTLPTDAMANLFAAAPANDLPPVPNYNICPTNRVAAVTSSDASRHLRAMRWGFVPRWYKSLTDGPLLINARAETIAEKPAFRDASRARRCLIPADGFYEWTRSPDDQRLPWYIHRADGAPIAFAGIWQVWDRGEAPLATCAIVTTAANPALAAIHDRMPVCIAAPDWPLWLGEAGIGAAVLMRPAPEGALAFYRVGREVNSNRASGSGLVRPLPV